MKGLNIDREGDTESHFFCENKGHKAVPIERLSIIYDINTVIETTRSDIYKNPFYFQDVEDVKNGFCVAWGIMREELDAFLKIFDD